MDYNDHDNGQLQILSWRHLLLSRTKLKRSSRTSALLSGFAMMAIVELELDDDTEVPDNLLICFGVCTTLLVFVHLLALLISTCILPYIEAVSGTHDISMVHDSPHESMKWCVELAWISSTGIGIILFLAQLGLLVWVKFYCLSINTAIASTCIVIPGAIMFVAFALLFYKSLMKHKNTRHSEGLKELEDELRAIYVYNNKKLLDSSQSLSDNC
ncbi:hypothetical protein LOTGIDRAFT_215032 [Lottia gigantea]|uniref:Calcium release-activated calcium channel protein 1 n=1 Tax=Lottia gigantea TaxID=225164 RepID=V3ZV74_LOTGI|nr:hypothetical protein LOTGIDRAFT_215032 [Lottia gigantea]ESO95378.1 hypothetical protein LOTGIDRAFT_215032 [Lottia gigantea]